MRKLLDDIVICLIIPICLGISLFLAYALVERQQEYPPTLIAVFLGIGVAALTYRFLGGAADTEFKIGLLKLGGAAALLVGVTWFIGSAIRSEQGMFETRKEFSEEIAQLEASNTTLRSENNKLIAQRLDERTKASDIKRQGDDYVLDQVKARRGDDPLISKLRRMVLSETGPFRSTIRELPAKIVLSASVDEFRYNICEDKFEDLYKDLTVNPVVSFARAQGDDGDVVRIRLTRQGLIDQGACSRPNRDFDVQLSCAAGLKLFPDMILSCSGQTPVLKGESVRGQVVALGAVAD